MSQIKIREGTREDVPRAMELIRELADFEKAGDQVATSIESMERDGFGPSPLYFLLMAEFGGQIVGLSLYYFRYSTWKGKRMYLEDLVVSEKYRGKGIGKALFEATLQAGKDANCSGMMWQVLDWNEPAINFYKNYRSTFDDEWINCSVEFNQ